MAIYTRTGDSGSTSLFTGQRVSKTHLRVETYGTLDELNATLSLCYCATAIESHRILLEVIQQQIFWFSAELASESEQPSAQQRYIGTEEIAALENAIDSAMNAVPPVHCFILPGTNLSRARKVVGDRVALQGNMDPLVLFADEDTIRREARKVLDAFGPVGAGGHVFNLGHGINQFTPVESVQILVDEVHQYSRRYHTAG